MPCEKAFWLFQSDIILFLCTCANDLLLAEQILVFGNVAKYGIASVTEIMRVPEARFAKRAYRNIHVQINENLILLFLEPLTFVGGLFMLSTVSVH